MGITDVALHPSLAVGICLWVALKLVLYCIALFSLTHQSVQQQSQLSRIWRSGYEAQEKAFSVTLHFSARVPHQEWGLWG